MKRNRAKRILTVLLIAAVCFAVLFSVCFLVCSAHHDCTGEDCVICAQISLCGELFRALFQAAAAVLLAGAAVGFAVTVFAGARERFASVSLVMLRVKLSD